MRVLVVGGGGREHALCWAMAKSRKLSKLWCAPGNAGTAQVAENVAISAEDIAGLVDFARKNGVTLVVGGPEAPLTLGLADACAKANIPCFGPSAAAAQLEGSKAFTKSVCDAAQIPTAAYGHFTDAAAAKAYVREQGAPIVVKADGLAAGKGVVVAMTVAEAEAAITDIMESRVHGEAGAEVVIEECLIGQEISFFALCEGTQAIALGAAQDHKRVGDGDTGPNTGGMGAYSPPPAFSDALRDETMDRIVRPALVEMVRRGAPFRGVLFCGLMLTDAGPKLIEFNVRFGDPECETLLPLLDSDLLETLLAASTGRLGEVELRWKQDSAVTVIMAANGYPGAYVKGSVIGNLDAAGSEPGTMIFHAGTTMQAGKVTAIGGRVLAITATGATLQAARDAAYRAVDQIDWPEGFCRRDIGWRAL